MQFNASFSGINTLSAAGGANKKFQDCHPRLSVCIKYVNMVSILTEFM